MLIVLRLRVSFETAANELVITLMVTLAEANEVLNPVTIESILVIKFAFIEVSPSPFPAPKPPCFTSCKPSAREIPRRGHWNIGQR